MYIYLIEFKPAAMKKKALKKQLEESEGVAVSFFTQTYNGVRIESDHTIDTYWLSGLLAEYGQVGNVRELTSTSDPAALPSRSLTEEEAQKLEKQLRKSYTSGRWITIAFFAICTIALFAIGISQGQIVSLLLGIAFLAVTVIAVMLRNRAKKEAAAMTFSSEDWTAIDGFCCHTWSEEKEERTFDEDGKEQIEHRTFDYYELAAGEFALSKRFDGLMHIGAQKTIYYNVKDGIIH